MEHSVRFIHTADLHLGSILHIKNKADKSLMDSFNNSVYYAFKNICDAAIFKKVDFVLISGDIYDRESRSVKGNSFFVEQCKRLEEKNIKVYAIAGNHDPISKNSELFTLPENVFVFSSENPEIREFTNSEGDTVCRIIGQSYREGSENRKMHKNYHLSDEGLLNIALLHTQLDNSIGYVPCTPSELKEITSIHYWALGHIHKAQRINQAEPVIVFPGIPQGRDFGEEGLNGALLVEACGTKITSIENLPVALVLWENKEINLNNLKDLQINNISNLEGLIIEEYEQFLNGAKTLEYLPEGLVFRWTIAGRSEIYSLLEDKDEDVVGYLVESLNNRYSHRAPFIFTDSISMNIGRPIENLQEFLDNNTTMKEVSIIVDKLFEDSELKKELIKDFGAVWEETENLEDINIKKLQLNKELYEQILKQAHQLIIDSFLEEAEA